MARTVGDKKLTFERTVRLKKQTEKLTMEVARLRGELVPLEEFKADVVRANLAVKARLLAIPARCVPRLFAAESPVILAAILQTEIRDALVDLSSGIGEEEEAL